jgi:hypothetical protein
MAARFTDCEACGRDGLADEIFYDEKCLPECDRYHSTECNEAAREEDGPCICPDARVYRTDELPEAT